MRGEGVYPAELRARGGWLRSGREPRETPHLHGSALVREAREPAGQHSRAAIEKLASLMDHEDPRVAIAACVGVLDRAGVKPIDVVVNIDPKAPARTPALPTCPACQKIQREELLRALEPLGPKLPQNERAAPSPGPPACEARTPVTR